MNKRVFVAMSALLGLAACNAVEIDKTTLENIPTDKQEVIITATATPNTKTVLDDDYLTVLWKPSEEIKIFSAGESSKFTSLNTEAGTVVQFRGMISVITGISEGVGYDSNIYGLYPYDDDATLSNGVITTTLPSTQTAVADSFGDDLFITIGKSQTLSMGFYNVCSGLRFSFSESGYTSLTLSSNNGEALAGTFSVGFDNNGKPAIQSVSSPATSITVNAPSGGFVANTWYYVICLPGTYTGGITLSATNGSGTGTYEITSSLTFERSRFKQVANLDGRLTFSQGNNEIWYTSGLSDVITPNNTQAFGVNIVSNTYQNGKGVITFDGDVQSIGDYAFYGCSGLESITLPESITSIGSYAFAGTGLFSITIPSQVQSIGAYAFYYLNLLGVSLPSSLASIGDYAFSGCHMLEPITLPNGLLSIGSGAFEECSALSSISIPNTVSTIGSSAFSSCAFLQSVVLPTGLTAINANCFASCNNLSSIEIPSSVQTIAQSAFFGCSSLPATLTIPANVSYIGSGAFAGCSGIQKVYVQRTTAAMIASNAFLPSYNASTVCNCKLYVPTSALPGYVSYSESGYLSYRYIYSIDAENIEPVDLGLSVKWAPINIGASSPTAAGLLFSWGEITPKTDYELSNYKWYNGSAYTKYTVSSSNALNGTPDNIVSLLSVDDAAINNWGGKWRMPTITELLELINSCNITPSWGNYYSVDYLTIQGPSTNTIKLRGEASYWSRNLEPTYNSNNDFVGHLNVYGVEDEDDPSIIVSAYFRYYCSYIRPVWEE